jgi:ADP-ribose pyrophosphatase YjhB (NUDIX family)
MNYFETIQKGMDSSRIFRPGVRAVIVNKEKELLLQHRKDNLLWGLPGGAVELDETAYEALLREVKEETSLEIIQAEPMALYSGPTQRFAYPDGERVQCFALAFIVNKWKGQPQADGVEGTEVCFFPFTQLPDDIVPIHKATIKDYLLYDGKFILSG